MDKVEWKNPYLIQRLERPIRVNDEVVVCPFSFGCGGGGIPKEASDIIKNVFAFDYMGSAEFEFGEVPKALHAIIKNREDFMCGEITFKGTPYTTYDVPEGKKNRKFIEKEAREVTTYFFCHRDIFNNVQDFIRKLRENERSFRFKESTLFNGVLFPEEDFMYKRRVEMKETPDTKFWDRYVGWFDLGNCFMFFIDKETFENSKIMFGIEREGVHDTDK